MGFILYHYFVSIVVISRKTKSLPTSDLQITEVPSAVEESRERRPPRHVPGRRDILPSTWHPERAPSVLRAAEETVGAMGPAAESR